MSSLSRKILSLKLPASVLVRMSDQLLEICKQCGTIYQYALDLAREQLLVEVEEFSATRLLSKFKMTPRKLGGYAIQVASTTRQEMIRAKAESQETASERKPAAQPTKINEFNPSHLRAKNDSTTAVLYAHVDKETAEVKHDVLRQAFAKYGRVVYLASFRYKGNLHCLVQYPDAVTAGEGLKSLNGMCIYDDCCVLRVYYSILPDLVFADDAGGCKQLVHHNPQVQVSRKTVENLQVWNPNKGGTAEHNRTKEVSRRVGHDKVEGSVHINKIPKITKFNAITNSDHAPRQVRACNSQGSGDTGGGTSVTARSKGSKSSTSRQFSYIAKDSYHKYSVTPIKVKTTGVAKQQKATKSVGQIATSKKHSSTVSECDNSQQPVTLTVKSTPSHPPSNSDRLSSAERSLTLASKAVKVAPWKYSSSDKVSSDNKTEDKHHKFTSLDVATFALSLDPSDYSDVDTDASTSDRMDDRLPPVSCHSVEVAVGCQDIIQSSIGIQCSMEDEELQSMVMVCREQLEELKKKATEITEKESCNKQLLLENANLKKLLSEVHNEMRRLKEVISSVNTKSDVGTQVQPCDSNMRATQDESEDMQCNRALQIDRQTDSPKSSGGSPSGSSHKRLTSTIDQDPTYEPSKKKKRIRKKVKSSLPSSPTSPTSSSIASPENNCEKTNGYALKIRKKFLHTHLQSFLKSQKFIKSKLDAMKEAMKSCSANVHQLMSKSVPQLERMYDNTVRLADLEQSGNEDGLFLCITELSALFPTLISDLSENLSLKVPGVSLTILSVLKKMEYLANEMTKYTPQSKTLAYGDANTGETISVEPSSSTGGDTVTTPTTPPPLLSLDEAVEMLDDNQQSSNESEEQITSLTISISTKFLRKIGGKQLIKVSDENALSDEAQHGGQSDVVPTAGDPSENQEPAGAQASPENSHVDTSTVLQASDEPQDCMNSIDIEVVENEYHHLESTDAAGKTADREGNVASVVNGKDAASLLDVHNSVEDTVLDSNNSNNVVNDHDSVATSTDECTVTSSIACVQSTATTNTTTCSPNQNTAIGTGVARSLPPFSAIPSNQSYGSAITPIHSSAPPPYSSATGTGLYHNLPITTTCSGFTPLLPQYHIPTPIINISQSFDGLVVKWTLAPEDMHLAPQVRLYRLCVFQGNHAPPPHLWHVIGEVEAMKLPMSCTLKCLQRGSMYHFALQATGRDGTHGQFSQSKVIQIY